MARIEGDLNTPIMYILGSDGTLRLQVDPGTEGAKLRQYETSDGKKGEKWELTFKGLEGTISNIQEYEGDYGKNLMVTIAYDGGADTVSLSTTSPFGEDFMKRLPSLDLSRPIRFSPYSFEDDRGKVRKGVSIVQEGHGWEKDKAPNFFYDLENKKNLHGYPEPEGDVDKYDKDDWKIYFTKCRKFLVNYTEEKIMPQFAHLSRKVEVSSVEYPSDFQEPTI